MNAKSALRQRIIFESPLSSRVSRLGSQAINRFRQSLTDLMEKSSSSSQCSRIVRLASDALAAGFEVLYLHSPHIAAANDKDMDRIESEIKHLDEVVRSSLKEMEGFVPGENQALLQQAVSSYEDFQRVTAEVIQLSRQNTNIKSFELSLGRKRKITAQCDEILGSLLTNIRSRAFEATR